MVKTLTRHGNSMALIIEKPILDLLGVEPDTPFSITTNGQVLILTPVRDEARRREFEKSLESVNRKYSPVLKKLAE